MIRTTRPTLAALLTAVLTMAGLHAQPREHVEVPRDQWQRVADVMAALGAAPGAQVADIGAGSGYFTTRLAKAVGATGRVYAVDVNPVSVRELKTALGGEYPNVEIVRGDEDNPRLPEATLDGILIVNAYHEFAEYRAMLQHLRNALKPGGRLVLIEPIPRTQETTRAAQTQRHTIAIEFVEADLQDAGFEIVSKDVAFVSRPEHMNDADRGAGQSKATDWLIVAKRAASGR